MDAADGDKTQLRAALACMQREFASTVEALEKQAAALAAHNALLATAQQQQLAEIAELREALTHAEDAQLVAQEREQALQHECAALKLLLQQEQNYWARADKSRQAEVEALHAQAADARTEARVARERNDELCREVQQLQRRVDTAARASRSLEQRLQILAHHNHDERAALEAEVQRLRRKVSEKREQNKYLSEALVAREEAAQRRRRRQPQQQQETAPRPAAPASVASASSSLLSDPITDDTVISSSCQPQQHKCAALGTLANEMPVRKRDMTLSVHPPPAVKRPALERKLGRHEDSMRSHALTSPTASSPDLTPPPSPSKQRDTSNARANTSRPTSDRCAANQQQQEATDRRSSARLEREMSDLRRKLDACMQLSASP